MVGLLSSREQTVVPKTRLVSHSLAAASTVSYLVAADDLNSTYRTVAGLDRANRLLYTKKMNKRG